MEETTRGDAAVNPYDGLDATPADLATMDQILAEVAEEEAAGLYDACPRPDRA